MFSQRLNNLKHQQDLEVARLRIEIDSMLNGALRLQEKEFEILPKLWELLDKCFWQLSFVTNPFKSYADIDMMNDDQVEELLAKTQFPESQKKAVRQAKVKSKPYVSYLDFERACDALNTTTELGNYLSLNGIMMPLDLKAKLVHLTSELSTISHKVRSHVIFKRPGDVSDYFDNVEKLKPQMDEVEALIRKRLASHARSFNG